MEMKLVILKFRKKNQLSTVDAGRCCYKRLTSTRVNVYNLVSKVSQEYSERSKKNSMCDRNYQFTKREWHKKNNNFEDRGKKPYILNS